MSAMTELLVASPFVSVALACAIPLLLSGVRATYTGGAESGSKRVEMGPTTTAVAIATVATWSPVHGGTTSILAHGGPWREGIRSHASL
jgi:hypothetical protein